MAKKKRKLTGAQVAARMTEKKSKLKKKSRAMFRETNMTHAFEVSNNLSLKPFINKKKNNQESESPICDTPSNNDQKPTENEQ